MDFDTAMAIGTKMERDEIIRNAKESMLDVVGGVVIHFGKPVIFQGVPLDEDTFVRILHSKTDAEVNRMNNQELTRYCGDDAQRWAQAFCVKKQARSWRLDDISEILMLAWFSNAIEQAAHVRRQVKGRDLTEIMNP